VRTGHGLGAKDHEADRWVAAVAVAGGYPLATEDAIFDDVVALRRTFPDV
jgi:predicted nucleic acid-binding protein